MNILFRWLIENTAVVAIAISIISLILSIVALIHSLANAGEQDKWYKLKKLWSMRHGVLYAITIFCLTLFVLVNWEKCISMQFFSQFNGNNVLFLVWIVAIMLFFYDIEIKESKLHMRNIEEAKKQVRDKGVELEIGQRVDDIERAMSEISNGMNGGDENQ